MSFKEVPRAALLHSPPVGALRMSRLALNLGTRAEPPPS
jgi:hypothetical protein